MKTITFNSNYGNFDYAISAEIGDDVNAATEFLCLQGMANLCYRAAGSNVDKALGAKDRKAVEYSEASGALIDAAVSKKLTELEVKTPALKALGLTFQVTGEHQWSEGTDTGPGKQAMLMAGILVGNADGLAKLGLKADATLDEVADALRKVMAAVRKPREKKGESEAKPTA